MKFRFLEIIFLAVDYIFIITIMSFQAYYLTYYLFSGSGMNIKCLCWNSNREYEHVLVWHTVNSKYIFTEYLFQCTLSVNLMVQNNRVLIITVTAKKVTIFIIATPIFFIQKSISSLKIRIWCWNCTCTIKNVAVKHLSL